MTKAKTAQNKKKTPLQYHNGVVVKAAKYIDIASGINMSIITNANDGNPVLDSQGDVISWDKRNNVSS